MFSPDQQPFALDEHNFTFSFPLSLSLSLSLSPGGMRRVRRVRIRLNPHRFKVLDWTQFSGFFKALFKKVRKLLEQSDGN